MSVAKATAASPRRLLLQSASVPQDDVRRIRSMEAQDSTSEREPATCRAGRSRPGARAKTQTLCQPIRGSVTPEINNLQPWAAGQ